MWETAGQMTWFLQQNERKKMREATYKLQGLEEYQSINVWDLDPHSSQQESSI